VGCEDEPIAMAGVTDFRTPDGQYWGVDAGVAADMYPGLDAGIPPMDAPPTADMYPGLDAGVPPDMPPSDSPPSTDTWMVDAGAAGDGAPSPDSNKQDK
jgi:hypothetical protein